MLRKILMVICCLTLFNTGCSSFNPISPIIQIGIYWMEGEAHKYYSTDQETLHKAVMQSLKELDIEPIKKDELDENGKYYIRAGNMGRKDTQDRFKIKVAKINDKVSKVSIRVNIFGDKPFAELIYKQIDKKIADFKSEADLKKALMN